MTMSEDESRLCERVVLALEKIATALAGLDDTHRRQFSRRYPEKTQFREAIVTRVPTEDDRLREAHGASTRPLSEWLSELSEEEVEGEEQDPYRNQDVGVRERAWLEKEKERAHTGAHAEDGS